MESESVRDYTKLKVEEIKKLIVDEGLMTQE